METKLRILIADANEDFRTILTEIIGDEEDMTVVGAAGDGREALAMLKELRPDVLLDAMCKESGIEDARVLSIVRVEQRPLTATA